MTEELSIVREAERHRLTGLSRTTWWRLSRQGLAPKAVQLGANSVGWLRSEIEQWIVDRANRREVTRR
jgi:prophage regulatory protein